MSAACHVPAASSLACQNAGSADSSSLMMSTSRPQRAGLYGLAGGLPPPAGRHARTETASGRRLFCMARSGFSRGADRIHTIGCDKPRFGGDRRGRGCPGGNLARGQAGRQSPGQGKHCAMRLHWLEPEGEADAERKQIIGMVVQQIAITARKNHSDEKSHCSLR